MKNPFRNLDKEELVKIEQDKKDIELRIKTLNESAKHILSSQDAIKYRQDLEASTKDIIKLMMNNNDSDMVRFAYFCKSCLVKLAVHYDILDSIEGDTK
jgi:hypothetical protein